MKNNKIIIYDDNCPLCAAYSKLFVSAGMIKKENRKNFTTIDQSIIKLIDVTRCSNEIPVIDEQTHEVWYGIDAMTEILQYKIPFAKNIVYRKPVKWLLGRFYKFISYNRRVIVATKSRKGNFDCTPDFNYPYRLAFMFVFLLFNTIMLLPVHTHIINNSLLSVSAVQLQQAHFLLVLVNVLCACSLHRKTAVDYLGQVNMLALTTILLLVPLIFLNKYGLAKGSLMNNIYLAILTLFIVKEYKRRMEYAGIIKKHPFIVVMNILSLAAFLTYLLC